MQRVYKRCLNLDLGRKLQNCARMASLNLIKDEAVANSETRSVDPLDEPIPNESDVERGDIDPLDEPIPNESDVERDIRAIENDDSLLTLQDFFEETWNSSFAATRNIRLMIGSVAKYLFDHRKLDNRVRRIREAIEMKVALKEIYQLWSYEGPHGGAREQMLLFARKNPTMRALLARGMMSVETFDEWVREHHRYVDGLSDASRNEEDRNPVESLDESQERRTGLDALFDHTYTNIENGRMPQHITKLENGRLLVARSPGEIGSHLIRLIEYDVKDITKRDPKNWWKHAKLRAQFLCSSSLTDRKRRLLRQLLDEAANDLRMTPGVLTEVRNVVE